MSWHQYLAILVFMMVSGIANVALPCAEPYDACVCPWVDVSAVYEVNLEGDTGALAARVVTVHTAAETEPGYGVGDAIYYQWLYDNEAGDRLVFLEGEDEEIISTFELDENGEAHCWSDPEVGFSTDDVASLVLGEARETCENRLQEEYDFSPYPASEETEEFDNGDSCLFFGCSTGMNRAGAGSAYGLIACVGT